MDKSILDMVHDSAKDLHAAGVMKETTLREFDALCLLRRRLKKINQHGVSHSGLGTSVTLTSLVNSPQDTGLAKTGKEIVMPTAIVLRAAKMIKDSGAIAAAKEFSDDVIKQAKKHIKDMKSKKTTGQKQSEKGTKGQRTYREGQRKAGVAGGAAGYTAGNVDLSGSSNSLPVADMSRSIDVRGTGEGIRYFQDGKEVRMPKKGYN